MARQAKFLLFALPLAAVACFTSCAGREVASSVSPDGRCRVTVRQWSSSPFSLDPGVLIEGRCGWRGYEVLKLDDWPVEQGEFAWSQDSQRVGIVICTHKVLGFDFKRGQRSDRAPEAQLVAGRVRKRGPANENRGRGCWSAP
ncbi:MAG: hypothetical protein J0L64_04050 [Acidobacteria bacterium]|nr:hypothetical protein [Acidobacteriota bacterium]